MNGRVFDPLTAQFFSPDPQLQEPGNWLNYNRYGYCIGNPMKYTDPSGEFFWLPLVAAMVMEGSMQGAQSQYFGDGYLSGFASGAAQGGMMYMASSILPGAIGGALGHGSNNIGIELARAGLHGLVNGDINEGSGGDFWTGFATGAVSSLAGSGLQDLKSSDDMVRFGAGAAGAITAGAMHGDAMSGFWQGYGIADQNHVGGEKGRFINSKDQPDELPVVTTVGHRIYKTWDPITSLRISKLDKRIQKPTQEFINDAYSQNIKLRLIQGLRTFDEQNDLYAQGRTKSGKKVTNAKGGQSYHNYGLAVDVAPIENGEINWNGDWNKIGKIGMQHGFEWGGNFHSIKDKPHFQMTFGLKL